MYLRRLSVQHLKRLSAYVLDFTRNGQPRMWTVLIGENGTAKTALLQAIALATAGSKQVNTLVGPAVEHLRDSRGTDRLRIEADFDFTPFSLSHRRTFHPQLPANVRRCGLHSTVTLEKGSTSLDAVARYVARPSGRSIPPGKAKLDRLDPLDQARATHAPLWFVAAYGISRALPDASLVPTLARPSIDRLEPLFKPVGLTATGFARHFRRKDIEEDLDPGETSRRFNRMLNQAVKLGGPDLFPDLVRVELSGQGGAKPTDEDIFYQSLGKSKRLLPVAGVSLSHGYQSTFAWIADLIGHVLLEAKTHLSTTEMEGLVLLDEIDLYLHPRWQRSIIPALQKIFPRMQFVATTHSPVVLAALAPDEIVRLTENPRTGDVEQGGWLRGGEFQVGVHDLGHQPDARLMTGGEILGTWFGLEGATPNPMGEKLRVFMTLASYPNPNAYQRRKLAELKVDLRKEFVTRLGEEQGVPVFNQVVAEAEDGR